MPRFLSVCALLALSAFFVSACDTAAPSTEREAQSITHTEIAEKYGRDAPWITWADLRSEYDNNGNRIRGQSSFYEDDGTLQRIKRDTLWYNEEGAFLRRHAWVQDLSDGETEFRLDHVSYAEEIGPAGVEVVIRETPDGEPWVRSTYRYDAEPFEATQIVQEIWRDGAWDTDYRITYLARDAAGRVLLRQTEEWYDGAWHMNTFFDQIERDEEGRVIRASEDGDKPMTFTYDDEGRLVEKTKKRGRFIDDRWRYDYTAGPVQKSAAFSPATEAMDWHKTHR